MILSESMSNGKAIVIVEDDAGLSRMYERAFRLRGHEVITYDDGGEVLNGIVSLPTIPSAIVMDVIIPTMTGIDLLRKIRSNHRFDTVPILMLTNSFNESNKEQFLTLGADLYLVKIEHQAAEVVQNVEALIQKHKGIEITPEGANGSILIVEDDEYIVRVYDRAFKMAGFTILNSPDGQVALEQLAAMQAPPLAIIMDLTLPKLGGENLFQAIRANERYTSIPIVVLTNSYNKNDQDRLLSLGADLFLIKVENTPDQIVEKVAKVIEEYKQKDSKELQMQYGNTIHS